MVEMARIERACKKDLRMFLRDLVCLTPCGRIRYLNYKTNRMDEYLAPNLSEINRSGNISQVFDYYNLFSLKTREKNRSLRPKL